MAERTYQVLIYAGTTEGRMLAEQLSEAGVTCDVRVATEYGQMVMPELKNVRVTVGRLTVEEMRTLAQGGCQAVVDATHPFATEVSKNIRESLQGLFIPYLRLQRRTATESSASGLAIRYFFDHTACAAALAGTEGNILLTTGSKELLAYCNNETLRERLFVRVLPGSESIAACEEQGIRGRQIIAMQGPFSREMNLALIRQFSIRHLVTKESGTSGGFAQKLQAAAEGQIAAYIIRNPEDRAGDELQGMSFWQVTERLGEILGQEIPCQPKVEIALVGIGMSFKTLTLEGKRAIEEADLIFGAGRMLETVPDGKICFPYYRAEEIVPVISQKRNECEERSLKVAILFSGDTGFYSGASKIKEGLMQSGYCDISVYPGVSSVSYLAAALCETWQDAKILSIHGRKDREVWQAQLLDAVMHHDKTYLLVSGAEDVRAVGRLLTDAQMGGCTLICGYRLSYPEEEILRITASEGDLVNQEGLYTCLIQNPDVKPRRVTVGLPDEEFLRDKVPMTKEEIREISICKLALTDNAVLYDVGSGTGSVAVECGLRSPNIRVYAIEQKTQAQELLRKNLGRFHLRNVIPVDGSAPDCLMELEAPTHVFIGGSGGQLEEILQCIWEKNPRARIVVNAISLETVAEIMHIQKEIIPPMGLQLTCECTQIQTSRSHELGNYHLMRAENPIYIFCLALRENT